MKQELDELLCKKYPKMFVNRNKSMQETAMCWGFGCGDGWFDLIDELCGSIQSYIDLNSRPDRVIPQVTVDQVKEKFGGLRFYYKGGDDNIHGMVRMAEAWADASCEECGAPGERRNGGWIKTLCDKHEEERQERLRQREMKISGFEE